jgi:hypothetical protein
MFPVYLSILFVFIFQKNQNLIFLNYNWLIFDEPKKPVWSFGWYYNTWVVLALAYEKARDSYMHRLAKILKYIPFSKEIKMP